MLGEPYGPHGAEEEREELWTDLAEAEEVNYAAEPQQRRLHGAAAGVEPYYPMPGPDVEPDAAEENQ